MAAPPRASAQWDWPVPRKPAAPSAGGAVGDEQEQGAARGAGAGSGRSDVGSGGGERPNPAARLACGSGRSAVGSGGGERLTPAARRREGWFTREPVELLRLRRDRARAAAAARGAFAPRPGAMHPRRSARAPARPRWREVRAGGAAGGAAAGAAISGQLIGGSVPEGGGGGRAPCPPPAARPREPRECDTRRRWWEADARLTLTVAQLLVGAEEATWLETARGGGSLGADCAAAALAAPPHASQTLGDVAASLLRASGGAPRPEPQGSTPRACGLLPRWLLPGESAHAGWVAALAARLLGARQRQIEREALAAAGD